MKTNLLNLVIIFSLLVLFGSGLGQNAPDTLWTRILGKPSVESYVKAIDNNKFIILNGSRPMTAICYNEWADTLWKKSFPDVSFGLLNLIPSKDILRFWYPIRRGTRPGIIQTNIDVDGNVTTPLKVSDIDIGIEYDSDIEFQFIDYNIVSGYIIAATKMNEIRISDPYSGLLYLYQNDLLLIKTDLGGDTTWTRNYYEYFGENHWLHSVYDIGDGFLIFIEYNDRLSDQRQIIMKTDYAGDSLWTNTISDDGLWWRSRHHIKTFDNGFLNYNNGILNKFDSNYEIKWSKNYEWLIADRDNKVECIKNCKKGGYIIIGSIETDRTPDTELLIFRLDENGDSLWVKTIRNRQFFHNVGFDIDETPDGGYIIIGETAYYLWLVRLGSDPTDVDHKILIQPSSFSQSQNYPNPFNPSTTIEFSLPKPEFVTLKIFNILGEEVGKLVQDKLQAGNYTYQFDGSNLASGVYLYRIEAGKFQQVRKMILLR